MDKLKKYKKIVEKVLQEQVQLPTKDFPNTQDLLIIDAKKEHFLQVTMGWDRGTYEHFMAYHVEVKADGKVWIHELRTDVEIDKMLIEKGVDKQDIVGGMIEPYVLGSMEEEVGV